MDLITVALVLVVLGFIVHTTHRKYKEHQRFKPKPSTNYECPKCPPHSPMEREKAHSVTRHDDLSDIDDTNLDNKGRPKPVVKSNWAGGGIVSADYCKLHCPGGCNRNCKGLIWKVSNLVRRKAA